MGELQTRPLLSRAVVRRGVAILDAAPQRENGNGDGALERHVELWGTEQGSK